MIQRKWKIAKKMTKTSKNDSEEMEKSKKMTKTLKNDSEEMENCKKNDKDSEKCT